MKPQVVVVGSFVQDLKWNCAAFPAPGETVVGTFTTGPGGKGSNQAVAAGRAGASAFYVGAIGDDVFGREAQAFYRRERIGSRFAVKPGQATGNAAILVNDQGQNQIVVALGANARLGARDVPLDILRSAKIVVCQLESNLAATEWALRTARKAGATTLLNPAPMRDDFDARILRVVDILIPNESEFVALLRTCAPRLRSLPNHATLWKLPPARLHELCRALPVPRVVVTLGAHGCLVSHPEGWARLPAHRGINVVDTTGAGDAFVGGFAAAWSREPGDMELAAHYGNAVAALSVTKNGTAPSMPYLPEIERFLKRRPRA